MISFSSLRSHPKVTLPSVDNGWLINSSITKDPPKSITTRRIDKVGDTQMVVDMIEDNGSRICGEIMKFPRGVNPAFEYTEPIENTVGSSATIRDNSNNPVTLQSDPGYSFVSQFGRGSGGYLARRIMMYGGAFRPPIMTQEQLLPLSRQPRIRTSCVTHPEKINYTKSCGQTTLDYNKIIKDYVIHPDCQPTIKNVIERSGKGEGVEHIEHFIQDKLLSENVTSGMRTRDLTLQDNFKCPAVTNIKPTTAYAYTTPCTENITRDSMLYVMQKPTSFIKDELLEGSIVPNVRFMDKNGMDLENTNVNKWILEYPRKSAGEPIVCAPRHSGALPVTEIEAKFYLQPDQSAKDVITNPTQQRQIMAENQNVVNFVKDDVLNAYDVMGVPTLDNIYAYNILDHNEVDMAKFINNDTRHSHDVHAGLHGSNRMTKRLEDAADFGGVKVLNDHIHADAFTQHTSVDKSVYMHSRDKMGKQRVIRQFAQDAGRLNNNVDDPNNYKRNVKLNPTLNLQSQYSIQNVGYQPQSSDRYSEVPVTNQISDGNFKNRVKSIYAERG